MSFLPLALGVRRKPDTNAVSKGRADLQKQAEKALARDGYACRCCGFQSPRFQRVIPGDVIAGCDDAFVTVCSFCEMVLMLEKVGAAGSGILIWLPEMTQVELNHLVRAIYIVREPSTGAEPALVEAAGRALEALTSRRTEAKKALGSDDPLLLAAVLHENLSPKEYAKRAERIDGIRLLPLDRWMIRAAEGDANQFPQMVAAWRAPDGPYGKIPTDKWKKLFDSVVGG